MDLLKKHADEFEFDLRLTCKGLYVTNDGLLTDKSKALLYSTGYKGAEIEKIIECFQECGAQWLVAFDVKDFEIDSSVA
jgi:hypothetical protein